MYIYVEIQRLFAVAVFVRRQRKFKIYVHPVPPAMDITRTIVTVWNKRIITKLGTQKPGHGLIQWLDFWPSLLNAEGGMRPEYVLDGIHLHPDYLPLLEAALNQLPE
jgi:hypothetical protein